MSAPPPLPVILSRGFVFFFFACILVLHVMSIVLLWYTRIWWIDVLLHILGGAWVALAFFYVQRHFAPHLRESVPPLIHLVLAVGVVMLVGVMWEWLEFAFDYFFFPEKFGFRAQLGLPDTMGDLLSDFIGGLALGWYGIRAMHMKKLRHG